VLLRDRLVSHDSARAASFVFKALGQDAKDYFCFFSPSLSLVVDPRSFATRSERHTAFTSSVDIVIGSRPPHARPLCVLDFVRGPVADRSRLTPGGLLRLAGIPYFALEPGSLPDVRSVESCKKLPFFKSSCTSC
jgi:hypothetical protein